MAAEDCDFLKEKSPCLGLKWSMKVGFDWPIRLNWALMNMGVEIGEPKGPMPDLTFKEKGFEESLGR